MQLGRCRDCETVYDYLELERCPKCGNFTGSAYGGVEVLTDAAAEPVRVAPVAAVAAAVAAGVGARPTPRTNGKVVPPPMPEARRLDVLHGEYALVEQAIGGLDRSALAIKMCSVTVGAVLMAYALASGRHEVLLVAVFA